MTTRRASQLPVLALNGSVVAIILVLVAVLALVVSPPAPPGIAAFAPEATKAITKAPLAQSAQSGTGTGACSTFQVCAAVTKPPKPSAKPSPSAKLSASPPPPSAAPSSAPPTSDAPSAAPSKKAPVAASSPPVEGVPSSLECYTWPDGKVTQTFDPESPSCVATWDQDKGNGGATTAGVTGTTIKVAFANAAASGTGWPALKPIVDFINSHFQLYGRQIQIVPYVSQQGAKTLSGDDLNDPALQHADAETVSQLGVFAATDFLDSVPESWSLPTYRDTLAQDKVITLSGGEVSPYGTTAELAANAPYEYSFLPTLDDDLKNVGEVVCKQLAGKPATHAGDASLQKLTRKFALMIPTEADLGGPLPGQSDLINTLAACGIASPQVVTYQIGDGNIPSLSATMANLQRNGVTSLIWFPYDGGANQSNPMTVANDVGYHPEWVTVGWQDYLLDQHMQQPASETAHAFGVASWNKLPQLNLEMWYQSFLAGGGDGAQLEGGGGAGSGRAFYEEMLMLASGIQDAGPDLTPATFAQGLATTPFPNPGAAAAPSYQATVGFSPTSPVMVDDMTGFWLDPADESAASEQVDLESYNIYRANCYADLGTRYPLGGWPTVDHFLVPGVCR